MKHNEASQCCPDFLSAFNGFCGKNTGEINGKNNIEGKRQDSQGKRT